MMVCNDVVLMMLYNTVVLIVFNDAGLFVMC